jgi:predicted ArsR family transcriptional regulator
MANGSLGGTQRGLLRALLHNKPGLTVDDLTGALKVSRNAVRQHLTALERDGVVARGRTQPSGGRPEQMYVITEKGQELFPRQYSWFSEMLIGTLHAVLGDEGAAERLAEMGRSVGIGIARRLPGTAARHERVAAAADAMEGLGYEAKVVATDDTLDIEAQNCVFHQLAMKYPDICKFDLALLSNATGQHVEHRTCMARGDSKCCFRFTAAPPR